MVYQCQSKRREQSEAEVGSPYMFMVFTARNKPKEEQAVSSYIQNPLGWLCGSSESVQSIVSETRKHEL